MTATLTHPDRLMRILQAMYPETSHQAIAAGDWAGLSPDRPRSGAPYVFATLADKRVQLTVENTLTGDRLGAVGVSREDVIAQIEQKLGL